MDAADNKIGDAGEGGASATGPSRVLDRLIPAPSLAEAGRHVDPFSLPHWHYLEVLAWIVSRDFGVVAGVRGRLGRDVHDAETRATAVLIEATRDDVSPVSHDVMMDAFNQLDLALANSELRAFGRRDDGDLEPIPPEVWASGKFNTNFGGVVWEGQPHFSHRWSDLRISHYDVQNRFGLDSARPPLRTPDPADAWVPITAALMWMKFHHAADIDDLNGPPLNWMGRSHEHVRGLLASQWRRLADATSQRQATLRGRPYDGSSAERDERDLTRDEVLNCKWFDWTLDGDDGSIVGAVFRFHPESGDIELARGGMASFSHVRVNREDLLRLCPVPVANTSLGLALSQGLTPVLLPELGPLITIEEARQRVATTFPPVDLTENAPERIASASSVADAMMEALRVILRSTEVRSVVCEDANKIWRVPAAYWGSFHDYRPLSGLGFFAEHSHGALALRLNDLGVHISKPDFERAMEGASVARKSSAKTRSAMQQWLGEQLATLPVKSRSRDEFQQDAIKRFGVSGTAFAAAWSVEAPEADPEWSAPGPRKRPRNR